MIVSRRIQHVLVTTLLLVLVVWFEYIYLRDYNLHRLLRPEMYENPFTNVGTYGNMHYECMREKRIVFAGLARNIHHRIRKTIQNCILLGSFFQSYKIVIFENDSEDNTRTIIQEMSDTNPNIQLIECVTNPECKFDLCDLYEYGIMNEHRIDRMTFFRNVYLSIIYDRFSDYDYLCVVDLDIDGTIPISGLAHALSCPLEWSCICANGRSGIPGTFGCMDSMYDAMALCLTERDITLAKRGERGMRHLFSKYLRLICMSYFDKGVHEGFIPVLSAFNGVAVYKVRDILGMYYRKGYSCEHISLHDQMVHANKKIYIDVHFKLYVGRQGPRELKQFFT